MRCPFLQTEGLSNGEPTQFGTHKIRSSSRRDGWTSVPDRWALTELNDHEQRSCAVHPPSPSHSKSRLKKTGALSRRRGCRSRVPPRPGFPNGRRIPPPIESPRPGLSADGNLGPLSANQNDSWPRGAHRAPSWRSPTGPPPGAATPPASRLAWRAASSAFPRPCESTPRRPPRRPWPSAPGGGDRVRGRLVTGGHTPQNFTTNPASCPGQGRCVDVR